MGIYVNPVNYNFSADLNSTIYVDKSLFTTEICKLVNTNRKYICVSRARRFGKSMAANMLSAYFSKGADSRKLFEGLKISQSPDWDKYLNRLNVIKFDLNAFLSEYGFYADIVKSITDRIRAELLKTFPLAEITIEDSLALCLLKIFSSTGEQFVIIIDEYDVLIREQVPQPVFDSYLRFLNMMFKNTDLSPALALVYLTGILPIVRDKIQSKLNLFEEFTMLDSRNLAEFVGFTTDEVKMLCLKHGMDFEECRRWYDGYRINGQELYSPRSVVCAIDSGDYGCYWTMTGTFESIKAFIQMNFLGLQEDIKTMLGGGSVNVDVTRYMNTMTDFHTKDDAFTYLLHIGYLAYDKATKTCHIPNSEIENEWVNAIENNDSYKAAYDLLTASSQLVEDTIAGKETAVATALDKAHQEICNNLNYNNEGTFQAVICLAFFYAKSKYTILKELTSGKGYADLVFVPYIPDIPAMIIELKRNSCPESALAQIQEKHYFASLEKYQGNLLFVGINYDETTKEHVCSIHRFVKE